jgi:hypothetical protein
MTELIALTAAISYALCRGIYTRPRRDHGADDQRPPSRLEVNFS